MAEIKIAQEFMEKAKQAESAEALVALAKEYGIEILLDQAAEMLEKLGRKGLLTDEDLASISGGTSGSEGRVPIMDYPQFGVLEPTRGAAQPTMPDGKPFH